MSGIRNLTGICHDIHRNRANVDTPPKRTEYLEQERAVLQEIISGKEAGCDISRTGMEKRQNKYLKERW